MEIEFSIKSGSPEKQRTTCLVLPVFEGRKLSDTAKVIDDVSDKFISTLLRRGDIEGKIGQTLLLHNVPNTLADRVLLIGAGKERDLSDSSYRKIISNSVQFLRGIGAPEVVSYLTELNLKNRDIYWKVKQAVEQARSVAYEFNELKSRKKTKSKALRKLTWTVPTRRELTAGEKAMAHGVAVANGMDLMRDLGNRPANICTPTYLGKQAQAMAKTHRNLKVTVLGESQMEKLGMGSLLSVSQGSEEEAKLIVFEYKGGKKDAKPYVFVGKGVTFDTGGISIKPSPAMDEMKYDMCGAASVIGTMVTVAKLRLPINLNVVVPAVENLPSGIATKPGDVVKSMSGQTIEILNTDAEGRLILCDALTYSRRFKPDTVIDVATLTGACVIALGHHRTAVMSTSEDLQNDIVAAGISADDRGWPMPLGEEWAAELKSNFADMANIGGRDAGTITAACFLSRFTKDFRWAHLDIAGTAWKSGEDKGASGRPVPLLTQFVLNQIGK